MLLSLLYKAKIVLVVLPAPNAASATAVLLYQGIVPVLGLVFCLTQVPLIYRRTTVLTPRFWLVVFTHTLLAAKTSRAEGTANAG